MDSDSLETDREDLDSRQSAQVRIKSRIQPDMQTDNNTRNKATSLDNRGMAYRS